MADFGRQLKEAREQQGVSLRQIATATKISVTALEALERNDFSRLPGGIFSRAFVRAYAIQVGLDPEQTVQDFLIEYELNDNAAAEKAPPEVTADDRAFLERQRRAAWWLRAGSVALVLGLMAVLIAWQVRRAKSALDRQVDSRPSQAASARRQSPTPSVRRLRHLKPSHPRRSRRTSGRPTPSHPRPGRLKPDHPERHRRLHAGLPRRRRSPTRK